MPIPSESLSLADLESFDPHAVARGSERRFCCPLPGCSDKSVNRSHQSLTVNTESGAWHCHRCGAAGKLRDFWEERPKPDRNRRNRAKLDRAFGLRQESTAVEEPSSPSKSLQSRLKELKPLAGSPAEAYLIGRGIPAEFIPSLRVLFAGAWKHWETREEGRLRLAGADRRVVFPVYHWNGSKRTLVATSARAIDPAFIEPKVQTIGEKKHGVFATDGALDADPILLTEAPIDALSLAACGFPAVALLGTTWPAWLLARCAFRTVLLGFDNDPAGEKAAVDLSAQLTGFGSRCYRLRPSGKDWNEDLVSTGPEAMKTALAGVLEKIGVEPVRSLESPAPALTLTPAAPNPIPTPPRPARSLDAASARVDPEIPDIAALYPSDPVELLWILDRAGVMALWTDGEPEIRFMAPAGAFPPGELQAVIDRHGAALAIHLRKETTKHTENQE